MGNCCKKDYSIHFGGEDWSSATSQTFLSNQETSKYGSSMKGENQEEGQISKKKENIYPFSSNNGTEVKIKISKKQLEELVNRGLTIEQVIIELMGVGDKYELQHQRSWRPALHSIPETDLN